MHPKYQQWLQHVFAHEVRSPQWYFDADADESDLALSDEDTAILVAATFSRSGTDLREFTDAQVNQGLWYLADPSAANFMFSIREGSIPLERKLEVVRSIYALYRDCFAARCAETLGNTDEPGASALNSICYMFWDVCPLASLKNNKDAAPLTDAIFAVLEDIMRIPHRACIEGGLHGLGELALNHKTRTRKTIAAFLETASLDAALRNYAMNARTGAIQ